MSEPHPLSVFSIEIDEGLVGRVFAADEEGRLRFGHSGRSAGPLTIDDLREGWAEFRDYVMEGGVRYLLRLRVDGEATLIDVGRLGTNRDEHLENHVQWQLGIRRADDP